MTNNLEERAKALEEKAKYRLIERNTEARTEKQRQWQACKDNAPEIALFLIELNKLFGKPTAVKVEINGETILKNGTPDNRKDLSVPKYSQQRRT